jgi:hypothetical protein
LNIIIAIKKVQVQHGRLRGSNVRVVEDSPDKVNHPALLNYLTNVIDALSGMSRGENLNKGPHYGYIVIAS